MAKFEYAPAPESRAVVTIAPSYGLFIGGQFVDSLDGSMFKTISPSSEEVLAEVTEAGEGDVDAAVRAARKAFEGPWGALSGAERGKYLFRIARILQERAREFAVLETLDNGKPIKESRDDYFVHRTGHGIGLSTHEPPYIVKGNTEPLQAGMCFSVEPGIYLPGRFGVRIENIVTVTADGVRSLDADAPTELKIVPTA